ncbi:MAG: APC family permease [Phycisphaerales bacterium]|nr:APC family permease [Phycisphaerales bacterium]
MADSIATPHQEQHRLGQFASTAICGNDITSSCLYVSAIAIVYAGRLAPICLLLVAGTLYLFRSIYAEVVGALPLNGGAYNALLNTTSKFRASLAACLTVLSYMATAVISSNEAMHYLHGLWDGFPVIGATIALLALFMVLTIIGITESAVVAIFIFVLHLSSMGLLLLLGAFAIFGNGLGLLWENLKTPSPGGIWLALFFGFAAAMLGVSGFESSANFVEQQKPGVFPKTLRNMWLAVTILNPGMAILALALIPVGQVSELYQDTLLSHMGSLSGGDWLRWVVSVDAVLVLSGATLTSYVGVTGLVERMTLDRCLPQLFLKRNRRNTPHRIIIGFFLLTVSVLVITRGELRSLAAVYTLSFLSVMLLFAIGNVLLKVKRERLPRPVRAPWPAVFVAIVAVLAALWGNARLNPQYLIVFLEYLIPTVICVAIMLTRLRLLEFAGWCVEQIRKSTRREQKEALESNEHPRAARLGWISLQLRAIAARLREMRIEIGKQQLVFFTRGDNLPNLNQVMVYIKENEHTHRVKIVTVVNHKNEVSPRLADHVKFLDEAYPDIDLDFVVIEGRFTPDLIGKLSKQWRIPKNLMFIGSPGGKLPYDIASLGGVRMII